MGIAALILGVLGLVGVAVGLPMMIPWLFFGGSGCSLAALVIGAVGRGTGGAARAGMFLGLLGVLGTAAVYFLFLSTREEVSSPTEVRASVPAAVEAKAIESAKK